MFRCVCAVAVALMVATVVHGQGYICAEGGGNEQNGNWAPGVFGWMVEKGSFGDVLILGVSGSDNAVAQTFLSNGAASATNLAVTSATANLQSTYDTIVAADIIWLRGGDQFQYVSQWKGTLTEDAIRDVYLAGGVVGGTSAGLHVLSEIVYDAAAGSLSPREALRDPFHPNVTYDDNFLGLLPNALLDSHFTERGRVGRLAVLLGRYAADTDRDILAIGVDDRTALCVSPDMTAEVRGEGAVTFLHLTEASRLVMEAGEAPVVSDIAHTQLTEGYRYDLLNRSVLERPANAALVGAPSGNPTFSSIMLDGDNVAHAAVGDVRFNDFNNDLALFYGGLQVLDGDNLLLRSVVSTQTWNSAAFDENRVGGPQYAIHLNPHFLAIYLDGGAEAEAIAPDRLRVRDSGSFDPAAVLLDSQGMISTAQSTYISSNQSVGPRQSVAIENAMLHVLRRDWIYDATNHAAVAPAAADLNGDGFVNGADLAALLSQWGADGSADLNEDNVVNGADLAALLAAWTG